MKKRFTLPLVTILIVMVSLPAAAQSDRMERDIRIAERVLEELFTPQTESQTIWRQGGRMVQSDYIPGTGVHFRVGGAGVFNVAVIRGRDRDRDRQDPITREWVEEQMLEYFLSYASQLGALSGDEQVRITFAPRTNEAERFFRGAEQSEPVRITAWVIASDLAGYSGDQLRERIEIRDLNEISTKRDLDIFAGVLEAAVNSSGAEHLRLNRKPEFEYLPGLGVHYRMQIRSGDGPFNTIFRAVGDHVRVEGLPNIQIEMDSGDIRFNPDSLRVRIGELERLAEVNRDEALRMRESDMERAAQIREEISQMYRSGVAERDTTDLKPDMDLVLETLREVMTDYAPTLSSLQDSELIMISIMWVGRNQTLPARTDIRTTKEDLFLGRDWNLQATERN